MNPGTLAGFTVGITADRRKGELSSMLERRGARVLSAPALRLVPLEDDTELLARTCEILVRPPSIVVATTGIGFRGWIEAADGWGLGDRLLDVLGNAKLVARGPKAAGALRAAGLREYWSPASEQGADVARWLLQRGVAGEHIAVQLHGDPQLGVLRQLELAGAEVTGVPVYRWVLPADLGPLHRLSDALGDRTVDALAFTSAPAAANLLRFAEQTGRGPELIEQLRDVLLACVGPVCAQPLQALGLECVTPERSRLGALVRLVSEEVPRRRGSTLRAGLSVLQIRNHAVVLDGRSVPLTAGPMSVLRALGEARGDVVSRDDLLRCLPGSSDDPHALDSTIARLRGALGRPGLVRTVVKRGYRLDVEPARS